MERGMKRGCDREDGRPSMDIFKAGIDRFLFNKGIGLWGEGRRMGLRGKR